MIKLLHYTVHHSIIEVRGIFYVEMATISWILIRTRARPPQDVHRDIRADVLTAWVIFPDKTNIREKGYLELILIPEEDLSTSGAQVTDAAVFMLLLQQMLTCSMSPLPGLVVAVVIRTLAANNFPCSLLVLPDLPVQLPQPVILGRGADAGGAGGPGEAAGGGDDRWPGGAAPVLLLLAPIRAVLQDVPADEAVSGLRVGEGGEAGVLVLPDVLLQGHKSDSVSRTKTMIHHLILFNCLIPKA